MMGGSVRHCHPLNDDPRNPYCKGVEGLLESYKTTLNNGKIFKLFWKIASANVPFYDIILFSILQRNSIIRNEIPTSCCQ